MSKIIILVLILLNVIYSQGLHTNYVEGMRGENTTETFKDTVYSLDTTIEYDFHEYRVILKRIPIDTPLIRIVVKQDTLLYYDSYIKVNILKDDSEFYQKKLTRKNFEWGIYDYHAKKFLLVSTQPDSIAKKGIYIGAEMVMPDDSQKVFFQDVVDFSGKQTIWRTGGNEVEPPLDLNILSDVRGVHSFEFTIGKKLPKYHFDLIGDSTDDVIKTINIYKGNNKELIQTINIPDSEEIEPPFKGAVYFCTNDFNFDGYQDIMLLQAWGATGNKYYSIWLYDKESGRFVYNDKLSSLGLPEVSPDTREIYSFERNGYGNYHYWTYKWIGTKLTLIREIIYECEDSENATRTESKRVNGKMKIISKKKVGCGDFEIPTK